MRRSDTAEAPFRARQKAHPYPRPRAHARYTLAVTMGLLLASFVLCAPSVSHAWTETMVTGAEADVHLEDNGLLEVALTAHIRITGGWLSLFDLDGLPENLELIADQPATITPEADGPVLLPKAEVLSGGRVRLTFERRRDAPRRGRYVLRLPFRTRFALEGAERPSPDTVRVPFRLPAWESGIEGAEVRISAPAGTVPVNDDPQVEASVALEDGRGQVTFRRTQLPRTVPLDVAVDVPRRALVGTGLDDENPTLRSLSQRANLPAALPPFHYWIACLALLKLIGSLLRTRKLRVDQRFLVPLLPLPLRVALLGFSAALPQLLALSPLQWLVTGSVVPVALVLERRGIRRAPKSKLRARPSTHAELRALRLSALLEGFDFPALLDLTTPAGALCAMGLSLLSLMLVQSSADPAGLLTALLPAVALFLSGTRRSHPLSIGEQARVLLAAQSSLPAFARMLTYESTLGTTPWELRLALCLPQAAEGLHQAALVMGELKWLDRYLQEPCWLIVVDAGSDADDRARAALPAARRQRSRMSGRVAYLAPARVLQDDAAALCDWLGQPAEPKASARAA